MNFQNVCIIGGGSLGHVITGWLAAGGHNVSILTRRPQAWSQNFLLHTPDGDRHCPIARISSDPAEVIPSADVILLTVPGYANASELQAIKPHLKKGAFVGGVFCSSGFFFEAHKILDDSVSLWGFQRVPFISRIENYGHSAFLKGFRPQFKIAVENASDAAKQAFASWVQTAFGSETLLLKNYLEASITNSNPILHTSRLYTMFADWGPEKFSDHNILFYEEWTDEAAELMIKMDAELFRLLRVLPVTEGYLTPLIDYYESHDAPSLRRKIASITGFKGILSPMKQEPGGWVPDYSSRYFTEDFGYSLRYIYELLQTHNIDAPCIEKVYRWGLGKIS